MFLFQFLVFGGQCRFPYGHKHGYDCRRHDGRDNEKQGLVIYMLHARHSGSGIHNCRHAQVEDAAYGSHKIDDGICLAAQGLCGYVGHQGHGGGAVGAHGNQQQSKHDDKGCKLNGRGFPGIAVVQYGKNVHENHCPGRTCNNVRRAAAQLCAGPVG